MSQSESGRQHLSPGLLRIVDLNGLPYDEMLPGQALRIYAQDAVAQESRSFSVDILEVRPPDASSSTKSATLQYRSGDFNFYDGGDVSKVMRLKPGDLMENGVSGNLYPQFDAHMVYLGGIQLGRDHSFEYVGSQDLSVIARKIEMIEVKAPPSDFKVPDLTEHRQKIQAIEEARKKDSQQAKADLDTQIEKLLLAKYGQTEVLNNIQKALSEFSHNGKIALFSYFMYAHEDGVVEAAWQSYQKAYDRQFAFDHPRIRGDMDFKASTRAAFMEMHREAGIKWPRPQAAAEQE